MNKEQTSISIPENRNNVRLVTTMPIDVKLLPTSPSDEIVVHRTLNISRGGISLLISRLLAKEAEIPLKLKFPNQNNTTVKCLATVKRCTAYSVGDNNQKIFFCGLAFSLDQASQGILNDFINEVICDGSGVADRRRANRMGNGFKFKNPGKFHTHHLSQENPEILIRQLGMNDINALEDVEKGAWGSEMCASRAMLQSRLEVFPEGMIGAIKDGKLLGYVGMMQIKSSMCDKDFTWMGITDGGHIRATHDPSGDCLYGVSLSVIPNAPKELAVKLLKSAAKLSIRKALKGIMFGCRIPNFQKYFKKMSIEVYINARTASGRILDPELALYQQVNGKIIRPINNYFEDADSLNYGVLISFENPFYGIQNNEFPFCFKSVSVEFT